MIEIIAGFIIGTFSIILGALFLFKIFITEDNRIRMKYMEENRDMLENISR